MQSKRRVETTGELRAFLAEVMADVRDGSIDIDKASRITKLAGQVNESMYAEIKVAKIRAEAGDTMGALGSMHIGDLESP